MRSVVFDIMRYSYYLLFMLLFSGALTLAQGKLEREHRINEAHFPQVDIAVFTKGANGAKLKRIRYYKTVDSAQTTYILKFKAQRIHYQAHFDAQGELKKIGFKVTEDDFPAEVYATIKEALTHRFEKNNIRKMFQEYTIETGVNRDTFIKNAFQNLLLPTNHYRFMVMGSTHDGRNLYEVIFDAEGRLERTKNALPPNWDRVLY